MSFQLYVYCDFEECNAEVDLSSDTQPWRGHKALPSPWQYVAGGPVKGNYCTKSHFRAALIANNIRATA